MLHMSQINYSIINNLLKHNNHIRGLAKDLNTNQTTIARKVKELANANIVDFQIQGKNKTYFLKKTLEAKEFLLLLEHNKLLEFLKKYPLLRNIIESIKNNNKIKCAILFGSYAKQTAKKTSDIDIFIETNSLNLKQEIMLLDSKLSIKTGKFKKDNLLIKEIIKNHIIIKGVERYYEQIFDEINF